MFKAGDDKLPDLVLILTGILALCGEFLVTVINTAGLNKSQGK